MTKTSKQASELDEHIHRQEVVGLVSRNSVSHSQSYMIGGLVVGHTGLRLGTAVKVAASAVEDHNHMRLEADRVEEEVVDCIRSIVGMAVDHRAVVDSVDQGTDSVNHRRKDSVEEQTGMANLRKVVQNSEGMVDVTARQDMLGKVGPP